MNVNYCVMEWFLKMLCIKWERKTTATTMREKWRWLVLYLPLIQPIVNLDLCHLNSTFMVRYASFVASYLLCHFLVGKKHLIHLIHTHTHAHTERQMENSNWASKYPQTLAHTYTSSNSSCVLGLRVLCGSECLSIFCVSNYLSLLFGFFLGFDFCPLLWFDFIFFVEFVEFVQCDVLAMR